MFQYDRTTHQAVISILSSPRGIWAAETHTRLNRSVRTAGRLPSDFNAYELLLIAFNSAARAISSVQESRLCEMADVKKLSILVTCEHPNFLTQLRAKLDYPSSTHLKVKNSRLLDELALLGYRYNFTLQPVVNERNTALLKSWADKHVLGGKQFEDYPIDRPTVQSVIDNKQYTSHTLRAPVVLNRWTQQLVPAVESSPCEQARG